jgi:hypothetical protein
MRLLKGLKLGALLLAFSLGSAIAETNVISLTPSGTRVELVDQNDHSLLFRVDLGELQAEEVLTPRGLFTRLSVPGFSRSHEVGHPELPSMNRLFEIPYGADVRVEVESLSSRRFSLADLGLEPMVFPAQASLPKNVSPEDWPFSHERDSYSLDRVSYERARVRKQGRLRSLDLGLLEVSPVEYFPQSGEILVHESLEVRLSFSGGNARAEEALKLSTWSPFFAPLYDRIAGGRGLHDSYPDLVRDVVTLVVVAPPQFEAQLQDFVDWKTERGFHTILAITGTPEVGTTKQEIRNYIHGLYNNATPELPAPSFVIFVGDVAQMPTWTEAGDATDRPYCDVEGDLVPDIYYGRFSATNPSQLQAILDKTLMYDQFAMPDPSYLEEVVMIAGMDWSHGSTWGNGQVNYGTNYYFNPEHNIYSHTYLYPESGSNSGNIIQHVSDGVSYINYSAHGDQTSWSDPYFGQSDINGLNNYGKYCLAVGNCCMTSAYDYGECFAETWLRATDKGAIGYIGGSDNTYWDEDYWWGVGNTSSIIANPTYEGSGLGAYDGLFHDHGEAETQHYVTNDAIIFSGNLAVMEAGSSLATYYWNIYNLMGDPSISTWIGLPQVNPVDHPAVISSDMASVELSAAPGSYVGLSQGGVLAGAGTVDASGTSEIELWNLDPLGGSLSLLVMAQNRVPYSAEILLGDVDLPEISVSPDSMDLVLYTGETDSHLLSISNTGEEGSTLLYSLSLLDPLLPLERSVEGSTLTPDPSNYEPHQTQTYTLTVYNNSSDYEWLSQVTLDFSSGVVVESSSDFVGGSGGELASNHATGPGALLSWDDENGGWGNIYGGESATCQITLSFLGISGDLSIPFSIRGDIYGDEPHEIFGNMILEGPSGPGITVLSPSGEELWAIGSLEEFRWAWSGDIPFVKIELSRDNGETWEILAQSTENIGTWPWLVEGSPSADCLAKISSSDGSVSGESNAPFLIFQPLDWIELEVSEGGLGAGETANIPVNLDASGLAQGDYRVNIVIEHNAPGPDITVPLILHVLEGGTGVEFETPELQHFGNFPNPFNPKTRLDFHLPTSGPALLQIHDVSGRVLRTLHEGVLASGFHSLEWDGRDHFGQELPSGIYFSRLSFGNESRSRKMLLLK